ncbi:KIDINS220 [Symbiodinium sp. CCMP2592]|nr:KIDINS220 [Symbiodinium sp. CCMP2592]
MLRLVGFLLIALAAGLRSKSDPSWPWEEHGPSSAEELQELLSTVLAQTSAAEVTVEEPGDVEARERTLRERIATITKDWQSASAPACHQQLGRLMNSLTLKCDGLQPKADWLLDYYVPTLPSKTCADSVSDIFALGNELVETLRVSRDSVASVDVAGETLRRYQALSFLRSWLVDLTRTHHHALLWAGFWDGDPENRTTMTKLSNFAKAIEHATVHPNTFLGRAIEASENLDACYEDALTRALAGNMWSIASMSFVLGMRERAQGTVIALVNKQITGERNLSQSVLSTHEIPTVGLAAWGLGFWAPKVLVVDLMGTCDKTSPALQKRLLARLPSWAKSMTDWSPEAFATRSRLQWQCIDCSGACSLDEAMAEHVEKLVEAKEKQDWKDQELRQVVSPHLAARAAIGVSQEELGLADKLLRSSDKFASVSVSDNAMIKFKLYKHGLNLKAKQEDLVRKAFFKAWGEEDPSPHLRVEQLLHQNADPSSPDRLGRTALMEAAFSGHLKVVEALLKAGAQLEAREELGRTALTIAATSGHLNVVRALVLDGAEPEACNPSCFMSVAKAGHLNVAEVLLKVGVPLEGRDERGRTALVSAATQGLVNVVDFLVRAGAQLEARDQHGDTALVLAASNGDLEVLEVLIRAGAQLEASCRHGTALTVAAEHGRLRVVESLLKARALPEAPSQNGLTALTVAAEHGHLKIVEALLEAGAQLEAQDKEGNTALIWAAREKHQEVVQALLEARAQTEARNADGFTALTWAVVEGQLQVVEALLQAGAHAEPLHKKLADHQHLQLAVDASNLDGFLPVATSRSKSNRGRGLALHFVALCMSAKHLDHGVMLRFTSMALAAFAATLYVAVGLRSEHHPALWHEHPASSAEKIQELLRTGLAQTTAAQATREEPGDAEAQERTLRELVSTIRQDWRAASASVCHQQLGRLVNNLTLACEGLPAKADLLLDYLPDSYILPNKTCAESVSDIFASGSDLVETLRVSRDAVASLHVDHEQLRRYQALSFVRSYLVNLTETRHHALLWAGFWDEDPENRTTKTTLSNFAKATEHATIHPDSFLGQAIEASENLDACYTDPQTGALARNMWAIASMSFVLGMREGAQGTVIALVNKQITGERNLSESVLSTHEIPTVGLAAWGLGF